MLRWLEAAEKEGCYGSLMLWRMQCKDYLAQREAEWLARLQKGSALATAALRRWCRARLFAGLTRLR